MNTTIKNKLTIAYCLILPTNFQGGCGHSRPLPIHIEDTESVRSAIADSNPGTSPLLRMLTVANLLHRLKTNEPMISRPFSLAVLISEKQKSASASRSIVKVLRVDEVTVGPILHNIFLTEFDMEDESNIRKIQYPYYDMTDDFFLQHLNELQARHGKTGAPGILYGFNSKHLAETGFLYSPGSKFHPTELRPLPNTESVILDFEYYEDKKAPVFKYRLSKP